MNEVQSQRILISNLILQHRRTWWSGRIWRNKECWRRSWGRTSWNVLILLGQWIYRTKS